MDGQGAPLRDEPSVPRLFGALDVPTAQPTDLRALLPFASMFTPASAVNVGKKRVGAPSDGGYVMLDDFAEPPIALSLGVGDETSWDRHMADLGAVVHQYDHTVEEPVSLPEAVRFHQKQIVDIADGVGVTIADALAALETAHDKRPIILKIDIEGDEWAVLDAVPDDVLARFDQIVGEYHNFEHVNDAGWFARASRVMAKLDRLFQVVHVHGNNHRPIMLINGNPFPWVLEVTHASRRRYQFHPSDEQFPTELDYPNHPHRLDFWLGSFSFDGSRRNAPGLVDRAATSIRKEFAAALVSYARNGEDVVLHRALREIQAGHYVDIGACDSEIGSVTKVFYDRGWSGINVEASKTRFEHLTVARPRDRNIYAAAAAQAGLVRFRDSAMALSSSEWSEIDRGGEGTDVPALSLSDICRDLPFDDTHFLRIDVGGAERNVLLGADFATFRPWIIVVAAGQVGNDTGWQKLLEDAEYDRILFDGVNLWFLARKHAYLRDRLEAPANIHDGYLSVQLARAEAVASIAREHIADLDSVVAHSNAISAVQAEERAAVELAYRAERGTIVRELADIRARAGALQSQLDAAIMEVKRLGESHDTGLRQLAESHDAGLRQLAESHNANLRQLAASHEADAQRSKDELLETRMILESGREKLERELDGVRQEGRIETERLIAELIEARHQLTYLAHFKAQSEVLRSISDIIGAGSHLEKRGNELVELRARLIDQANAWQIEVERLQMRLGDALSRSDMLYASTSWRLTSPLRGLRRATHVLRREPHRVPGFVRHRTRAMFGRPVPSAESDYSTAAESDPSFFETGTRALISVAARLDSEMAIIADLIGSVSSVLDNATFDATGPSYDEARLDERLTRWILADVVRQRRAAL